MKKIKQAVDEVSVRIFCNCMGVLWFIDLNGYKDVGSMNLQSGGLGTWRGHSGFNETLMARVAWAYRQRFGLNKPPDDPFDVVLKLDGIGDYEQKQLGMVGI